MNITFFTFFFVDSNHESHFHIYTLVNKSKYIFFSYSIFFYWLELGPIICAVKVLNSAREIFFFCISLIRSIKIPCEFRWKKLICGFLCVAFENKWNLWNAGFCRHNRIIFMQLRLIFLMNFDCLHLYNLNEMDPCLIQFITV